MSIQTEREMAQQVHPSESVAGIDMGIARFATVYDGKQETAIQPLNSFRKHEARLRRYQRAMARKQKFSQNWKKAKARIQHTHTRIANVRRDFLHKTSTTISQNHAIVVLEDLQVRNMSKSAMGTREVPGRNVTAKTGLNKSILDQGWAEFRRQLAYECMAGRRIDRWCRHKTPAGPVRPVGICRQRTAQHKLVSRALYAATRTMPILSVQSIF